MGERDEVERVPVVVADLDERLIGVGLHDRANDPGWPPAGINPEFDDIED